MLLLTIAIKYDRIALNKIRKYANFLNEVSGYDSKKKVSREINQ
jgi:hypothetical protein